MRFFSRALGGLLVVGLTLGLLLAGAGTIIMALKERAAREARPAIPHERVTAVSVATFAVGRAHPVIVAYGHVESRRTLELRAAISGPVIEIAGNFRDGALVEENTLLVRIDPAEAMSRRDSAQANLAEAEAEIVDARAALRLAEEELAAARTQRDLRRQALERQEQLRGRLVATEATVEAAQMALSQAEQALINLRQALSQAQARITRAELARDRARLALADAERQLRDTEIRANFTGLLSNTNAVLGRRVTANETLGRLIDPGQLEVAFRVSNAEFARLLGPGGKLRDIRITAALDLGETQLTVPGKVLRAGAEVGSGQTGRLLYAALETDGGTVLRPGDFLTVTIAEPPLDNVAVIPASAATEDGRVLVLGADDRLREVTLRILRRQRDSLVVAGAPDGARYVVTRLPTLGAGLKVRPVTREDRAAAIDMVTLSPEHRAELVARVEANRRMPAQVRAQLLARLKQDAVPQRMVERLEGPGRTIRLTAERRAALIARVKANAGMPADLRDRLLERLQQDEVPLRMIERLEAENDG
ncbi:MAG: HlyD family efflux transporter periplasmic adaptor subunit [Alphaproteobacteria bacterium]|nr:MAG: HlyD family efflux transporter periplasmic adaptor subunit [Alphaproteobacteria bacterium]